jgi:hypothetical protein
MRGDTVVSGIQGALKSPLDSYRKTVGLLGRQKQ